MDANVNCIKLKQTNKVSLFYVYKNIDMQVLFTLIVGNFFFGVRICAYFALEIEN